MANEEYTLAQEHNQQGMVLFSRDKYEEAQTYFERAIEEDPRYTDPYINIAQIYIVTDNYEEAKKWLNKAVLLDKKCAPAYFHLGNIALLQNDTEGARTHYTKAISLGYDNTQIYLNLALDAEERGDVDTALSYYNRVIAIDKFNAVAKVRKAQVLIALKSFPEALQVCDNINELNPDVFEGYHYKFSILCDLGKLDEADAVLDRAITLFPDDDALYYDKARLLHAQGRLEEALNLIDTKVAFNDENRTSLTAFRAQVLLALERTDEALEILLAQYPATMDGELAFLINSIYIAKKDYNEVLRYSKEIIDHDEVGEYYYAALYYHAVALSKLGRKEEADTEFENAQKIFRAECSRHYGQLQLYFYRAMCYEELAQYDKALEMTDYLLSVDEELYEAHLIRMKVYQSMGKEAEAENEKCIIEAKKPELLKMMEE